MPEQIQRENPSQASKTQRTTDYDRNHSQSGAETSLLLYSGGRRNGAICQQERLPGSFNYEKGTAGCVYSEDVSNSGEAPSSDGRYRGLVYLGVLAFNLACWYGIIELVKKVVAR